MKFIQTFLAIFCLASFSASAVTLEEWIQSVSSTSVDRLLSNIHPEGTAPGVLVASPSKNDPDYFYHWTRDAALSMEIVRRGYEATSDPELYKKFETLLVDFIEFSKSNQEMDNMSGKASDPKFRLLGEPKFHVDGKPFNGPWGRPQFDGPALRVVLLTKLAHYWLDIGRKDDVHRLLYKTEFPATSLIKRDLECVYYNSFEPSFDLWEESLGDHFYTQMVQRRALMDGADLADRMGDPGAANEYRRIANQLEQKLNSYWSESKKILRVTVNRVGGVDYKHSELDSAIVLAVLHGYRDDGFFPLTDSRVMSTVHELENTFKRIYKINHRTDLAPAIGRYPEDRYNGIQTDQKGSAWFLITAGLAEYYYRLSRGIVEAGEFTVDARNLGFIKSLGIRNLGIGHLTSRSPLFARLVERLNSRGDSFFERIRLHGPDGYFTEQFNRDNGFKQGAVDLTWSYAAFLTAAWQRP